MVNEMSWHQFSTLPGMNKVPQHEVERQYRIYINEVTMQRFAMIQEQIQRAEVEALAQASQNGGGGHIVTEIVGNYIEFVADAIYNAYFEIATSKAKVLLNTKIEKFDIEKKAVIINGNEEVWNKWSSHHFEGYWGYHWNRRNTFYYPSWTTNHRC